MTKLFFIWIGKQNQGAKNETEVGRKVVNSIAAPYLNVFRSICFDNFFMSIPLVDDLWRQNTRCLGTVRSNKPQLPVQFLKDKSRKEFSSLFAFNDYVTAVSYVPTKGKVNMRLFFKMARVFLCEHTKSEKRACLIRLKTWSRICGSS